MKLRFARRVLSRLRDLREYCTFVWMPLALLAFHRLVERVTARRLAAAGPACGALWMTHNVPAGRWRRRWLCWECRTGYLRLGRLASGSYLLTYLPPRSPIPLLLRHG